MKIGFYSLELLNATGKWKCSFKGCDILCVLHFENMFYFQTFSTKRKMTLFERLRLQKVYELIQVEHSTSIGHIIYCTLQWECNDNMKWSGTNLCKKTKSYLDNSVKLCIIIITSPCKFSKVSAGQWGLFPIQLHHNLAHTRVQGHCWRLPIFVRYWHDNYSEMNSLVDVMVRVGITSNKSYGTITRVTERSRYKLLQLPWFSPRLCERRTGPWQ